MADLSDMFRKLKISDKPKDTDVEMGAEGDPFDKNLDVFFGEGEGTIGDNTIILLMSLHGGRLEHSRLSGDLPENILFGVPSGVCTHLFVGTDAQKDRIDTYRSKGELSLILEAYHESSKSSIARLKANAHEAAKASMTTKNPGEYVTHRLKYGKMGEYLSRYSVEWDHHYQCDTDRDKVFSNGVFILGCNFNRKELLEPVKFKKYRGIHVSNSATFQQKSARELQEINLLNLDVLKTLSHRVTGVEHVFEPGHLLMTRDDDTGIEHYHDSKLSDYLKWCKKIGAEKVIIIDETCRINSFRGDEDERAAAGNVTEPSKPTLDPRKPREPKDPTDGGTRRKIKRRRSRRLHKKS